MILRSPGARRLPLWLSFGVVLVGGVVVIGSVVFPVGIRWMALPDHSGHRSTLGGSAALGCRAAVGVGVVGES